MSYYIALVFVGVILGVALVFAIRSRSPLRASAALVGIFLVLAGPLFPIPGPQATPSTAATVQDFGDAAFKKFYDHYAALLGAPVASAGQQGGVLSQWFRYALWTSWTPVLAPDIPTSRSSRWLQWGRSK